MELQAIGAATQEADGPAEFRLRARFDPGINEGLLAIVDPQTDAVFGPHDKVIDTGFGGENRAVPANGVVAGIHLLRLGARFSEIEFHLRINAGNDELFAAFRFHGVVVGLESAGLGPDHRPAKTGDQFGDGIAVLPGGQPSQFDPGRLVARLGVLRIERVVNVGGNLCGIFSGAFYGIFGRHRLGDELGKLGRRTITDERLSIFGGHTLTVRAVTRRAPFLKDLLATVGFGVGFENAKSPQKEANHQAPARGRRPVQKMSTAEIEWPEGHGKWYLRAATVSNQTQVDP